MGLREGVHIWIPGQEPTFLPGECEQMGPSESYEEAAGCLLPRYNRTHSAGTLWDPRGQNLTWGPGLGPESPPCRLLSKYHGPKWGSDPSTSESLVLFNSTMGPEGPGENKVPIYPQTQLGRKFGRAQLG